MSSLWTPSGEHPLDDGGARTQPAARRQDAPAPRTEPAPSDEELAAVRRLHQHIRATPALDVVANHGVQLFELALVYLGVASPPDEQGRGPAPDLAQAGVAIDALAALTDGLGTRLGAHEATLRDALAQIQMLYVRVADQTEASS